MMYLLDSNAAIALLKEHPRIRHHVRRVGRSALRLITYQFLVNFDVAATFG